MVTAYDRAREVYQREPCARFFEEDLYWHLQGGWVISTPTLFMMARRVSRSWDNAKLLTPWEVDPAGNAVWVWMLAGCPQESVTATIWPDVPWIGWERDNKPRWRPRHSTLAKLQSGLPCRKCVTSMDPLGSPD